MSLADRIAATSRKPTATVRLNGARWADVLSLSREQSYGQGASSGEVVGRNPPVTIVEGETRVSWTWGYDGHEVSGFSGVVTKILQKSYPNQWRLQVADPLWLAGIRRSDLAASPLNDVAASAAITQFLGAAGLTRLSIPALAASGSAWGGSEWKLGQLTPVSFSNTTPLAACQEIAAVLGYWLYATADGTVKATLLERRPSDSPFRTLRWGEDFLLTGAPDRERDASQVKNRVVVKGANTGVQGAQIHDEWQTGDADRSLEYSSALIEFVNESEAGNASVTGVAKRLLKLWSRQPNVIRVGRLKADPRIAVGMTLGIECAPIGYGSPKSFFIYSLSSSMDLQKGDFAQSLTLDGGTGDQGYTTLPPPEASFAWRLVAETLNGTSVIEVFLDGSGSHSLGDGEIVAWAWTTSTAVLAGTADTATGAKAMFIYSAATATASITLTVTDTSSKTGSITQDVTLAGDATTAVNKRVISVALGSAWAVTSDGGATWGVEATGDCTLVPEIGGPQLLATNGAGSSYLRGTSDALATASTPINSFAGTITALSVTEGLPLRVWAAVGTALERSIDGGATFAAWATLPASVIGVLEDPAVIDSVFCLAGANVYHGTDVLYAGPAGATARQMARGQSGATTWVCYTGSFIGSPLQRIEGPITATFPVVSPAVTEIRALALAADELTVWAWDAQGRGWTVDSTTGIAVANGGSLAAGETAMHALGDPDDPIVYLATFGAAQGDVKKYWPLSDSLGLFYRPAAGQQAHRVGLGTTGLHNAILYVLSSGVSGAGDGIWRNAAGAWSKITPPHAAWYWRFLLVSPANPQHLLLAGNTISIGRHSVVGGVVKSDDGSASPLYVSTDGGATWVSVTLGGFPAGQHPDIAPIWGATTGGAFVVIGQTSPDAGSYLWRLSADSPSGAATLISATRNHYYSCAGTDNDLVTTTYSGGTSARAVDCVRADGSLVLGSAAPAEWTWIARAPGTRTIVGFVGADLYCVADYRAASAPALLASALGGRGVGIVGDAAYVGGAAGVTEVAGLSGTPSASVVALPGSGVAAVAADSATNTAVAALSTVAAMIAYRVGDGAWQTTGTPPGVTLADWVEVVAS
jgi:hypothetical protein